jgi:uncharacterized protein
VAGGFAFGRRKLPGVTLESKAAVDAGKFGQWLEFMRAVLRGERDADVPCGDCVGCCVSSYPIPLRPTDRVALERVPPGHLHLPVASGGLARMGYRSDGTCPMLCASKCTIYSDRPQTCRDYDCRIYAASGLLPDGDRPVIRQRVQAWQFQLESAGEQDAAASVRRAAKFIVSHAQQFPGAMRAGSATAVAVLAVKCHALFSDAGWQGGTDRDDLEMVQRVIDAVRVFDTQA